MPLNNDSPKPWTKHYEPEVVPELKFENRTIMDYLGQSFSDFPNNAALVFQGYKLSFAGLKDMVDRFASALSGFGIEKGDAVAILLPNSIPCVAAYYAILKIGGVVVMNNPLYSDRELSHQFNDSGAKALITLDLLANRMIDLRPMTRVRQIVYTSMGDYLPFPKNLLFPLIGKKKGLAADVKQASDVYKWKELISGSSPASVQADLDLDDLAMFQYTGGTTGVSKGVMLTHGNLSRQFQQVRAWFNGFDRGKEVMLGALPFFHVFGLTTSMNMAACQGWTNVLVPKPQAEPLLDAISKFKPTFAPLVPTMYIGMLSDPRIKTTDLTSISACFSGSAPLPVEVIKEFEKITGATIVEGFGMTESSPVTHINPLRGTRKPGSIGIPIPNTDAKIVDLETGDNELPQGESGELIIRGPQVMKGYWNRMDDTAETIRDGWLYTGDIAKMDDDGYFYIVDRKKDMILSGGYNVYPRDIDEVYYLNDKVQEVCTVGIPHPSRGEAAKVFIVLKEGVKATEKEMLDFVKDRLAKYKWPVEIEFRTELPKTNVGKILRKDLRAEEMAKRG
ncbi:Long-chain-fatty-acid CoA ligase (AMP-forming) [Desulfatibacillum aliphaticivorans]|uniref:Long-chain-fatty-acid CoA ligase (AMP-forming) n=1 Tax=Desulfatibacillum aliphaticivorans TaxID=218208 RepID=B8FNN7_DESAL|nr:long-chain fatty acid--CoA ligase [Desulfatibacillum aliphaticivorans]ACL06318.1 Long-chain-fatty-acid CoA ligase (AMP-forming) [Desulfatibacillum aliphaticivorans]